MLLLLAGLLWSQSSLALPLPGASLQTLAGVLSPVPDLVTASPVGSPAARTLSPALVTHQVARRDEPVTSSTTIVKAFRLTTVQPSGSLPPIPEAPSASSRVGSPQYVVPDGSAPSARPSSSPSPGPDTDSNSDDQASSQSASPASGSDKCGPDEAAIVVTNKADHDICYMVELSAQSNRVKDITAPCGPGNGFVVPAGKGGREFCPGNNFVGALTAFHQGKGASPSSLSSRSAPVSAAEKVRGTRFEFNYENSATWYDVDYEMGIDSSTLAPTTNGKGEQVGERDIRAKVDVAYQDLSDAEKSDIKGSGYVDVGEDGKVKAVRMDKKAPDTVVNFLLLKAGLAGYVNAGTVDGEKEGRKARFGAEGVAMADRQTKRTGEKRLLITSY